MILLLLVAASASDVSARIARDRADKQPIVAHVLVALADNDNQGIVPVPKAIGNGQAPSSNLYWGARYGVKTYFERDSGWVKEKLEGGPLPSGVLERLVFRTKDKRHYVVADAYDGRVIQATIEQALRYLSGEGELKVALMSGVTLNAGASAHVVAFVGHDGLMDFSLPSPPKKRADDRARAAIVLACYSKSYFAPLLAPLDAHPLLLTTGLMAPEAYVLYAALDAFFADKAPLAVRDAAAAAYHQFQHCGEKAARRLFTTTD